MSTVGTVGNVLPFVALGEALLARGHDVDLITNCRHVDRFTSSKINFIAIDDPAEYDLFLREGPLLNRPTNLPDFFRRHYLPKVQKEFKSIEQRLRLGDSLILANEAPGFAARMITDKYRVPFISVLTYPNHLSGSIIYDELVSILSHEINLIRNSLGLKRNPHLMDFWACADRYLALWPDWFHDTTVTVPPRTKAVGFIFFESNDSPIPIDVEDFLSGNKPVLITGGTGHFAGEEFFKLSLEACRRVNHKALVVSKCVDRLSLEQASDLCWVAEVPSLSKLMTRVSAVIHHGGMGTIGQAISAGIPQLILANGGDRPANGNRIEALNLGKCLLSSRWKPELVAEALMTLTGSQEILDACSEKQIMVNSLNPISFACDLVDRLLLRGTLANSCAASPIRRPGTSGKTAEETFPTQLSALSAEKRSLLARLISKS